MSREAAFHDLLCSLFEAAHLRRFLRFGEEGDAIARALPADRASFAELVDAAVVELDRRGVVAAVLERLRHEFPSRRVDIDRVAALWSSQGSAVTAFTSADRVHPDDPTFTPAKKESRIVVEPVPLADPPADVAILIALREEWEVLWPIAGKPRGTKDASSGRYLYRFDVPNAAGRPYHCIALCMGDMGPGQATDATHVLLQARPRTMVNLGIAAAIHEDLKLCDVVVANQVDDYIATVKATARDKDDYAFELRGSVYKSTYSLVQDVDHLEYTHPDAFEAWRSACSVAMTEQAGKLAKARKAGQIRDLPKLAPVHLASGPVLAAAEAFVQWVRKRDGLLKALEMEAAGMMLAAHQRSDPTLTFVLRGISDFGDRRKSKTDRASGGAFRYLAMFNATQLLWAMLGRGLLPQHGPTPSFEPSQVLKPLSPPPGHEPATFSGRPDALVPVTAGEPNWTTSGAGPVALPAVAVDASAYSEIEFDIGSLWGLDRGPWIGVWHGPVDAAARTMHECERLIRRVFVDDPEPPRLATRRWHRARVTRGGDIPRDLNDLAALSAPERFGDPDADELGVLLELDRESFEREARSWISALARLSSWPAIVLVAPLSARAYALSARKQLAAALPGAWVDVQIAVDTTARRSSEDRHAWPRRDGASASAHDAAVDDWTEAILGGTSERPAALPADWGERLQAARSSADGMHPLDRYESIVLGLLRWANRGVPERLPVLAAALEALPGRSHPRLAELVRQTLTQADPGSSEWQPDGDVALVALRAGLSPPPPRAEDPRTWWPVTAQPPSQRLLEVLKRRPAAQRGMFGLYRPEERRVLEADKRWHELATECRRGISRHAP